MYLLLTLSSETIINPMSLSKPVSPQTFNELIIFE